MLEKMLEMTALSGGWVLIGVCAGLALSAFVLAFNFGLFLLISLSEVILWLVDDVRYRLKKLIWRKTK